MKRLAEQQLLQWMQQPTRKPVLLDGARQVGKSYLLENLFGKHFNNVHRFDFLAAPQLQEIFNDSLESSQIISSLELMFSIDINTERDLIIFDEIGECPQAVDSLKYFAENSPTMFLCASGSNIGLLQRFPVGKVTFIELFPLTFEEFLMASAETKILDAFQQKDRTLIAHNKIWEKLLDYYFVGGMPEAVKCWFELRDTKMNQRIEAISTIHTALIKGYESDFGKYADIVNAIQISQIFHNVPIQLSANMDDSVKRYRFKQATTTHSRYFQIRGPIDFLEKTKLISKCYPITSEPVPPLKTLIKDNCFKLFFFDVGLLGHELAISYLEQTQQSIAYKGFIAENFVQNEMRASGIPMSYSWQSRNSEIEFLYKNEAGLVIPIEVKSGQRTRAKSLAVYRDKYKPVKTLKLIGSVGGTSQTDTLTWPLYYAAFIKTDL